MFVQVSNGNFIKFSVGVFLLNHARQHVMEKLGHCHGHVVVTFLLLIQLMNNDKECEYFSVDDKNSYSENTYFKLFEVIQLISLLQVGMDAELDKDDLTELQ